MTKAVDFIKLLSERDELQWLYDDVVSTIRQGLVEEANSQDPDKFELIDVSVLIERKQILTDS
ncbi:hypothetical protein [Vibrio quintilis]|uniref:Uncharacterized protein n=1 Tax=Vibrio quintilis TaxID=1117707 RepID=A0A1M7YVA5_9VIBR|nr:hypothetical protein [Vibrio quintilis]SHO56564.1 hypothetical protein VQ7734_02333 [Vibrio quintilis]